MTSSTKNYAGIGGLIVVATIVAIFAAYIGFGSPGSTGTSSSISSSETTTSQIQGIVTGYVTVGPSQPVCPANQSCNFNLTGYSLVFTSVCSGSSCQVQTFLAPLSPSGHYSILLYPGEYSVTGLSPSCSWMGCSATFPQSVIVVGGSQLVMNFNVDTGIR
jgi:hypothetical protein